MSSGVTANATSLVVGLIAGALLVVLLSFDSGDAVMRDAVTTANVNSAESRSPSARSAAVSTADPDSHDVAGTFSARLGQYAAAARLDDAVALESRIQLVLGSSPSVARSVELEALLARLFELDPRRAVTFVQTTGLQPAVLSAVFKAWAEIDLETATELVGQIAEPRMERVLAFAILDVAGTSDGLIERLLAAGRTLDRPGLQLALLAQRAATDPLGALRDTSQLQSTESRAMAAVRIAQAAATLGPEKSIEYAQSVTDPVVRIAYVVELYRQWSRTDPAEFLEHLKTRDPNQPGVELLVQTALPLAAEADPNLTFEVAAELGGRLGFFAESAALEALAAQSPKAALDRLQSLAPGGEKDQFVASVAKGYARFDVDAALSWVASSYPTNVPARLEVMTALASTDLARAIDVELATPRGAGPEPPASWLMVPLFSDLKNPGVLADRLSAAGSGPRELQLLTHVMSRWTHADPYAALGWMRAKGDVPVPVVTAMAGQLGETGDIDQVIQLADVVAPRLRANWIEEGIAASAVGDPVRAMEAAARFRTEPFYESVVTKVAMTTALLRGPQAAAELLGALPPQKPATFVGQRWAEHDPAAAARWALTLQDPTARAAAVGAVVATWVRRDIESASTWAQSLGDRPLREQVLADICRRAPGALGCG